MLFRGRVPIPGAGAALQRLQAAGMRLVYATNNSTQTTAAVAEKIAARTGFAATASEVATSGLATARYLVGRAESVFVIGGPGLPPTLRSAGVTVATEAAGVDAVVLGLDRDITYDKLTAATLAVRAGAALVATNSDATFPVPDGLVPGAGALLAALERATDVEAVVCGKPYAPMGDLVSEMAGSGDIVMVGDRVETDIEFGRRQGWRTVLTLTGVTPEAEAATSGADDVIASIAQLPELLGV